MDGRTFVKCFRDAGFLDRPDLKTVDLDLIFTRCKTKGARKMSFGEYGVALGIIAEKLGVNVSDVEQAICETAGPIYESSVACHAATAEGVGPERFFYDKSTYTGTHRHGGPRTYDDANDFTAVVSRKSPTEHIAKKRLGTVSPSAGGAGRGGLLPTLLGGGAMDRRESPSAKDPKVSSRPNTDAPEQEAESHPPVVSSQPEQLQQQPVATAQKTIPIPVSSAVQQVQTWQGQPVLSSQLATATPVMTATSAAPVMTTASATPVMTTTSATPVMTTTSYIPAQQQLSQQLSQQQLPQPQPQPQQHQFLRQQTPQQLPPQMMQVQPQPMPMPQVLRSSPQVLQQQQPQVWSYASQGSSVVSAGTMRPMSASTGMLLASPPVQQNFASQGYGVSSMAAPPAVANIAAPAADVKYRTGITSL